MYPTMKKAMSTLSMRMDRLSLLREMVDRPLNGNRDRTGTGSASRKMGATCPTSTGFVRYGEGGESSLNISQIVTGQVIWEYLPLIEIKMKHLPQRLANVNGSPHFREAATDWDPKNCAPRSTYIGCRVIGFFPREKELAIGDGAKYERLSASTLEAQLNSISGRKLRGFLRRSTPCNAGITKICRRQGRAPGLQNDLQSYRKNSKKWEISLGSKGLRSTCSNRKNFLGWNLKHWLAAVHHGVL